MEFEDTILKQQERTRENWIDHVKVLACIFVALGHFFQSMITAELLPRNALYEWFIQTIYYFHVPLFFICSGYLYQKYTTVNDIASWRKNVLKKLLALGIPYFTFSLVTWLLKTVFSGAVNSQVNGLMYDLFVHPMSPYWYLFSLFFMFVVIPTFSNLRTVLLGGAIALMMKLMFAPKINAVAIVTDRMVWFILGMGLSLADFTKVAEKASSRLGLALIALFLGGSVVAWYFALEAELFGFVLGVVACAGVILVSLYTNGKQCAMAPYTMPIFLMHTIFAAGFRSVLFKLGVSAAGIHIVVGLAASFVCPIIAAEIMKRLKLDFFYEPMKYIRLK